jgi:hypothetical protein
VKLLRNRTREHRNKQDVEEFCFKPRGRSSGALPPFTNTAGKFLASLVLPKIDLRRPRGYLDRQRTGPQELVESGRFCFTCGRRAYTVIFQETRAS